MRILFIKPPNYGVYHEICRYYPLGLAYLASVCVDAGHEVKILDCLTYTKDNRVLYEKELSQGQKKKKRNHPAFNNIIKWGSNFSVIERQIRDYNPDIVAVTAMHSAMYDSAYDVVALAKSILPQCIVIMGGAHASVAFEHILNHSATDYVLVGEGEKSIVDLLTCLGTNTSPSTVDGIAFWRKNSMGENIEIIFKEKKEWICNLDEIPFPSANLLDIEKYDAISMVTGRGCPNACAFCGVGTVSGNSCRLRSPENVLDEITMYVETYGASKFHFEDDNFLFDYGRATKILDLIKVKYPQVSISFPNGLPAYNLDENMINKIVALNPSDTFIGLESTSSDLLKQISKTFTSLSKVEKIIALFRKKGINVAASLIIGFPDETLDMIFDDIVNLSCREIYFGTANPYYPIPGTKLYDRCLRDNLIDLNEDFTWFDEFNFPIQTKHFSRQDVYNLWSMTLSFEFYPFVIQSIKSGFATQEEFVNLFNKSNCGEMYSCDNGIYCYPRANDLFCNLQHLSTENDNANVFVDSLNGDMLAAIALFCTGKQYKAYQITTSLVPNGQSCFWLEICDVYEATKDRLNQELHENLRLGEDR